METKKFYENKSVKYGINAQRKAKILDLIPQDAKTVLDIGCAGGELARAISSQREIKIYGVDISQKSLDLAKDVLDGSFCFNIEDDIWPSNLLDKKFDLIIASEVIEHLLSPAEFLEKIKTLVVPGGKVIITTPNFLFWKNRLKMLLGKFEYTSEGLLDFGHIRFFTIKTASNIFQECGFKIEKENHFYPNLYRRKLNFLGIIFPGFFAYQFIFRLISQEK